MKRLCRAVVLVLAGALVLPLFLPGGLRAQDVASLSADSVLIDRAGRLVASGDVEIWHRSVRLRAARVTFDRRSGRLDVAGPIVISEGPDRVVLADAASLSADLREGIIRGARLVLDQQLQVAADRIDRRPIDRRPAAPATSPDGTRTPPRGAETEMTAVIASTCRVCAENPTPLWEVRAARVRHDEDARTLHFERAQFRLRGVPVAYLPRLRMPEPGLQRAPGMLAPHLRATSDFGFSVGVPFFIPLGPARDLTLTPQLGGRGMVALGFRYRQAFVDGALDLRGQISRDGLTDAGLRGYAHLRALARLRGDFVLDADVLVPSDRTYLETYGITNAARLTSSVSVERIRRYQAIRARVLSFRSLRAGEDSSQMPDLALQADWQQRIALRGVGPGGSLRLGIGAQTYRRPALPGGGTGRDLARLAAHAHWQRQDVLAGGLLLTSAVQGRVDHLRLRGAPLAFPDPVTRAALEGMADLRLPLARTEGAGGRQLLEPVAQIVLSRRNAEGLTPDERARNDDHRMPELDGGNLFAMTRFSGFDAPDDGSRLNLGLRWLRESPSGWTVETLVGRVWRRGRLDGFDATHRHPLGQPSGLPPGRTRSDWLLAGRVEAPEGFGLDARLLINTSRDLERGEATLSWQSAQTGISTTYLYIPAEPAEARARSLGEWSLDVNRRLSGGWTGFLGWDYDTTRDRFSGARTGLVFHNECLSVDFSLSRRFATSTTLSASTRVDLRVELLGIGSRPGGRGRACPA